MIVGGDFNMVRGVYDKSTGSVDARFMEAFNNMITETGIRQLHKTGSRYTWSNKQLALILSVLDRVLVSNSWKDRYNRALSLCLLKDWLGSQVHNPLIVNTERQ